MHVGGNYFHFHAAFSLLCLLPTKEIISGGEVVAQGSGAVVTVENLTHYIVAKSNMQTMSSVGKLPTKKKSRLIFKHCDISDSTII